MQIRRFIRRTVGAAWAALGLTLLCLALTSCGGASASANGVAVTSTPTCPPAGTATASLTFVSGKITSAGAGSITVTPASGASVTVQIAATTSISKLVTSNMSLVQVGQAVQVTPDATGTVAQRITVQGGTGRGSAAGGHPSATRVPSSRVNPACFRRTGQSNGGFGVAGGQGERVSQVSSSQIVLTDAQGQTLTYGISANTVILTPTTGSPADLTTGATVTVSGQAGGSSITARSIVVISSGQ